MIQSAAAVSMLDNTSHIQTRMPESSLDGQRGINQNSVSRISGDHMAEGIRTHLDSLLVSENKVRRNGVGSGADASPVKVIDHTSGPDGTKVIGETKSATDDSLRGLTNAFEYSSNMALVSLVMNGLTNGITTLTSKGG